VEKSKFRKLKLTEKYQLLKNGGVHLASREFNGYWVHLFSFYDFHVEVWILQGLNQIRWIEIQENQSQIDLYTDKIDISHLFG
jgi:hypothetical protein